MALLYFPGALVPAESYVPLARDLQAALRSAAVHLHVVIASGHRGIVDLLRAGFTPIRYCRQQFAACIAALRDRTSFNPTPQQLFIAGHSMGGMHATVTALNCKLPVEETVDCEDVDGSIEKSSTCAGVRCRSSACAGVVLHGSYATAAYLSSPAFPPVATILGDRDGLVHLSHIAVRRRHHLQSADPDTSTDPLRTPLVILPGVSHASFAAGAMTGFVRARDLPAAIPPAAAAASIAAATAAFLIVVSYGTPAPPAAATAPATRASLQLEHPSATEQVPVQTPAQKHRCVAAQSASAFLLHHLQHATNDYLDPYTDALQRDLEGTTCMDAQRSLLVEISTDVGRTRLDNGDVAKSGDGGASEAATVLPPTLVHEQPRRLRAPPRLRRDAFARAAVEESRGDVGTCGSAASREAPGVRPCASLSLRRPPGFRISIPAAPTRLRCKLATRRAPRAAAEPRSDATAHITTVQPAVAEPCSNATPAGQLSMMPEPAPADATCGGCGSGAAAARSALIPAAHGTRSAVTDGTAARVSAYTVANANQRIMERVLRKLPQHVQHLYRTAPRPLVFGTDIDTRSASEWLHMHLLFHDLPAASTRSGITSHAVPASASSHGNSSGSAAEGGAARAVAGEDKGPAFWRRRPEVQGVMLRSPRFVADAERVLCCTLLSEAQAFEYALYGSQRVPLSETAEAECVERSAEGDSDSPVVQPAIWLCP